MHLELEKELLVEKAIAYITLHLFWLPVEHKPTYFHCIRVGLRLREKGYDGNIIVAWFLHDLIEDTSVSYDDIACDWSVDIADIVLATTKDMTLEKSIRNNDLMYRAATHSYESALIKAVDLIDGLCHYKRTDQLSAVENRSEKIRLFLSHLEREWEVFDELRSIVGI